MSSSYPDDPYPPAGYAPPPYAHPPYQQRRSAGMAVAAMVLGIVAIVLCWTVVGGFLLGLLAVILGIVALRRIRRGEAEGRGRAVAGIVTGALGIVLAGVLLPLYLAIWHSSGVQDYVSCVRQANGDQARIQQCQQQFQDRIAPPS